MSNSPAPRSAPVEDLHHVFVRDLVVPWLIGIHGFEKEAPQRVRFTIGLVVHGGGSWHEHIVGSVQALLDQGHVNLVETLAERLAALCLRAPGALSVRVRVEKLDIIAGAASVGIEIERVKTA